MKLSRRGVVTGGLALAAGSACASVPFVPTQWYVGTYSDAIYPLSFRGDPDKWQVGAAVTGLENAAFGLTRYSRTVWMLHESGDNSAISRHVKDKNGGLKSTGRWPAQGNSPCYIAADNSGKYFATANYGSGNVVIWRDGETPEAIANLTHSGQSANRDRQNGPHSHWVGFSWNNDRIYSVDLGTDEILTWPFDPKTGKVGPKSVAFRTAPGAGPRHMLFRDLGRQAYIINELDNTLIVLTVNADGSLTEIQKLSSLPADFTGTSYAAHIALSPSDDVLYVSNRGHNSIAVFDIAEFGKLTPKQWVDCGGDWPRFFLVTGTKLWVANQKSNDLVLFDIAYGGRLTLNGLRLSVPSPIFIDEWPTK